MYSHGNSSLLSLFSHLFQKQAAGPPSAGGGAGLVLPPSGLDGKMSPSFDGNPASDFAPPYSSSAGGDFGPDDQPPKVGPEGGPPVDPSLLSRYGPLMAGGGAAGLGLGGLAYYLYNRSQQEAKRKKERPQY